MKLVAISVASWIAGVLAYLGALFAFWGQTISRGDLRAVVFWSALVTALAVATAYAPAMFALRARSNDRVLGWLVFPLVGVALGVVPTLLMFVMWSNNIAGALRSPEAVLFYCMFAAFGAVFGTGFFVAYGRRSV